jgi:excisionase family DNA binding protein
MDLIRASEAAELLGVRRETVYVWATRGRLKIAMKVGNAAKRENLYDRAYIEEVAKNRRAAQTVSA